MLARVCHIDLETITPTQRGKLNQTEKLLREKKGVGAGDIRAFGIWWFKHHWKGQDGQPPRPMQVREDWGKFAKWRGGHNAESEAVAKL